jgi:enoyl-CoA hydratase/carnithine racemase
MGYALSMGSIIMLAADRVEMAQNSLVMIHRAQGWAQGDAKEMRAVANRLETHEEAILPLYQQRMRLSEDAVRELLQNQTWYSAKRALAAGLIDAITDPIDLEEATKQIDANAWEECMGDQCTMPDNYKQLVENIIYPKTALEKVLEFAVGKPAKPITLLENKEDLDMDKEELQKMLDAQSEKLEASFDEKLAEFKKDANEGDSDELTALKEKLANAEAEIAELSKPDGVTEVPENIGNSIDSQLPEY